MSGYPTGNQPPPPYPGTQPPQYAGAPPGGYYGQPGAAAPYPGYGYPAGTAPPTGQIPPPTMPMGGMPGTDRPPREHCFMVENPSLGVALEIEGSSVDPNSRIVAGYKSGGDNQLWFEDGLTGTIKSRLNMLCLHINEYNCAVVRPYVPGDLNQQWLRSGDRLKNRMDAGKVLALSNPGAGSNVISSPVIADNRQIWHFPPGAAAPGAPSPYPAAAPQPAPPAQAPVWTAPVAKSAPQPVPHSHPVAQAAPQPAPQAGKGPRRYFYIRSAMHGKVLDVHGAVRLPGTKVIMWPRKGAAEDNQLWYADDEDIIHSKLTDFVLQQVGNQIVVERYNGQPGQMWVKTGNRVAWKSNPGTCLDITGEQRGDGATLCQYQYKASANQHWHFDYLPPNYFFIRSEMHGKVLDVEGERTSPGTPVVTWPVKRPPAKNQLWYIDEEGIIRSKLNNFALQPGGAGIVLQPYNGQANQQWVIRGKSIVVKSAPQKCLDIHSANRKDGAKLCMYPYGRASNQHWHFDFV